MSKGRADGFEWWVSTKIVKTQHLIVRYEIRFNVNVDFAFNNIIFRAYIVGCTN